MQVKKPKIWNIAILSGVFLIALFVLMSSSDDPSAHAVALLLAVYLALVLVCLIVALIRQLKYNIYSYNVIFYFGFAVFTFVILLSHIFSSLDILSTDDSYRAYLLLAELTRSIVDFTAISAVFVGAYILFLIVSNVLLIIKEGPKPVYFVCIAVGLAIGVVVWLFFRVRDLDEYSVVGMIAVALSFVLYLYLECMVTGAIFAVIVAAKKQPAKDRDYILILGCGLNDDGTPAPILARRIDRALRFYQEQIEETKKAPILIPSGGKGTETRNSESEAMNQYLLERNVPPEHIIKEDRSTTTWENMVFSKELIDERDPDAKTSFVTSSYHVFRSGVMAGHAGLKASGIGARTEWYFWPNAILREFISLLTSHVLKQVLVYLAICAVFVIPILFISLL